MPLIDFPPPTQSWADYLAALPPGRTPAAQDMFDRWDAPLYICPSRPRNGTPDQFAKHDPQRTSIAPGHCKCGTPYKREGLRGVGEQHSYLAWLAGMMDPAESAHFWATVASARPERLMELGVLPVVREMLVWVRGFEGGA